MKEKDIQKAILDYLRWQGILVLRTNAGKFFIKNKQGKIRMIKVGESGISDIIFCLKGGIFGAIECKTPKGKLTLPQSNFLEKVKRLGGIAFVATNLKEVIDNLKKYL